MRTLPKDFTVVDDAMAAILRTKTEAERLAIAFGMWDFARQLIWQTVAAEHPDWNEQQVRQVVAWRLSHGVVGTPAPVAPPEEGAP